MSIYFTGALSEWATEQGSKPCLRSGPISSSIQSSTNGYFVYFTGYIGYILVLFFIFVSWDSCPATGVETHGLVSMGQEEDGGYLCRACFTLRTSRRYPLLVMCLFSRLSMFSNGRLILHYVIYQSCYFFQVQNKPRNDSKFLCVYSLAFQRRCKPCPIDILRSSLAA